MIDNFKNKNERVHLIYLYTLRRKKKKKLTTDLVKRHLGTIGRALDFTDVLRILFHGTGQCFLVDTLTLDSRVQWQISFVQRTIVIHEIFYNFAEGSTLR